MLLWQLNEAMRGDAQQQQGQPTTDTKLQALREEYRRKTQQVQQAQQTLGQGNAQRMQPPGNAQTQADSPIRPPAPQPQEQGHRPQQQPPQQPPQQPLFVNASFASVMMGNEAAEDTAGMTGS